MAKKTRKTTVKAKAAATEDLLELESRLQAQLQKIEATRKTYLADKKRKLELARSELHTVQARLSKARTKTARAAADAKKTGSVEVRTRLKKARAAQQLLMNSLKQAREALLRAQSELHAAKVNDRKLAARAKVLEKFEQSWKQKMETKAAEQARKAREAAARRRNTARKRAVKSCN